MSAPSSTLEPWTNPHNDPKVLAALHAEFEIRNAERREKATPEELRKNNGFPTISIDEMIRSAENPVDSATPVLTAEGRHDRNVM